LSSREFDVCVQGKATDVREVAKTLGVRYVLEGSVRRIGAQVRVTRSSSTNDRLCSDRYDEIEDISLFRTKSRAMW